MFEKLSVLKGLHPGIFLERELQKRGISKRQFGLSINEFPQTIGSITKGKRDMNTQLSLRIEKALGLEEGFLMMLQVFYDIKKEKLKCIGTPDLSIISPGLFWDTAMENIDWHLHRKAIVDRVFEYGSQEEKLEIERFYGKDNVAKLLEQPTYSRSSMLNGIEIK